MGMTRISDAFRLKLLNRLLEDKFGEREKALKVRQFAFAWDIYASTFSESDRDRMDSLPPGWMMNTRSVKAQLGGIVCRYELEYPLPVPYSTRQWNEESGILINLDTGPLVTEQRAIEQEKEAIESEKRRLNSETLAVLRSVTTLARLVAVWPEIKTLAEKMAGEYVPDANLPAPKVEQLNAAFDLPKPIEATLATA